MKSEPLPSCVVDAGHVPCGSGSGMSDRTEFEACETGSTQFVLRQAVEAWAQAEDKGTFLTELVQSTKATKENENVVLARLRTYNRSKVTRSIRPSTNNTLDAEQTRLVSQIK